MQDDRQNPPSGDVQDAKRELRQAMLAKRSGMTAEEIATLSRQIQERLLQLPEIAAARSILVYVSCGSEVRTIELINLWLQEKTVVVPKVISFGEMEAHRLRDWDELVPGPLRILSPRGTTPYEGPLDVCVVPGVAFTVRGDRLGRGHGHYDRFLSEHPGMATVALAFESQIAAQVPLEPSDQPMDIIVTESRVIRRS